MIFLETSKNLSVNVIKYKGDLALSFKILVMSCDKYSKYTFEMFHHCIEKYWPNHPEVIYCTETIENPYYKTITINLPVQQWTRRLNQALN